MRKSRVLVVDDDPWLRPLLGTWLAEEGYDVLEAGSGPEALKQVRDEHPDLEKADFPAVYQFAAEAGRKANFG